MDKDAQTRIFHKLEEVSEAFCPTLLTMLDRNMESIRAIRFIGSDMRKEDLYWTLLPFVVDRISNRVEDDKQVPRSRTERPGNGRWDVTGYEHCTLPYSTFVGRNGAGNEKDTIWAFKINMNGLTNRAGELFTHEVTVLANVLKSNRLFGELSHAEQLVIRSLIKRGFLLEDDNALAATFMVITGKQEQELTRIVESEPLFLELQRMMEQFYDFAHEEIGQHVPARLDDQLKFAASQYLFHFRMMALRYALEHKRIEIPEQIGTSTIGMFMTMND